MNDTTAVDTIQRVVNVVAAVRKYLKDKHPGGAILEVAGVRQDREWWSVSVRPSFQPPRRFEYYEALATAEQELQKFENLAVLLVPSVPAFEASAA